IVLDTTQCCCSSVPTSVPPPRFALLQDPATPKIYTLSLHDALPIYPLRWLRGSPRSPGLESLERLEERCGAESRELSPKRPRGRSEEHTSELQSPYELVCRLLLEKKNTNTTVTDNAHLLLFPASLRH